MSLKAKIEAVVYAAEEPVTLAQLAVLFSEEALEWKREHEVAPEPANEAAEPVAEQVPLPDNVDGEEIADDEVGLQPAEGEPELHAEQPAPDPAAEAAEATTEELVAAADAAALSAESDAKRAAKQRDRDVREILRGVLDELIREYAQSDRGIEIRQIAGGYRIGTKPEYHDSVRSFVKSLKPPMKLSLQALETLAVIAYKQPVTAPEVSEIRGVDTSGVLGSLISRKLITTAGRKQVIGRPILYKTTKEFLLRFGLKDVSELPSIEEFEKMAGELADADVEQDPHVAAPEELPFFEAPENEGADDEVHTEAVGAAVSQSGEMEQTEAATDEGTAPSVGTDREYVTATISEAGKDYSSVADTVAIVGEGAVSGNEGGYPSEAQTVPGGAGELPEDLKEDR